MSIGQARRRGVVACGMLLLPLLLLSPLCSLPLGADGPAPIERPPWPDTFVARVAALALIETFNADLLSHESATLTLERWCAEHRLATPARIVAARVDGADEPASPGQRDDLGVTAAEPIRYRHVRLLCGSRVLSEARNWYVPSRLTPAMNRAIDTTDTPFGKAVQPLHFRRHTLAATLLWSPLPDGWEMHAIRADSGGGVLDMPHEILRHRALLSLPDGTPFSEVEETYTADVLGFALLQPP